MGQIKQDLLVADENFQINLDLNEKYNKTANYFLFNTNYKKQKNRLRKDSKSSFNSNVLKAIRHQEYLYLKKSLVQLKSFSVNSIKWPKIM